ncbi:hypothetical protein OPW02_17660 [Vibrio europaeus]|uniref:hypothetical protein n=1 Tax=Vibrio europaeus TaxID=300876 RepID=UPI00233EB36C|nr:hypothetical protein [Vibrio europaeus]MDC5706410.1 hypothetical protein [Vibrio europaeus]MDC5708456.1 hypothetical protein [Vibrio europaeus]MDC5711725.1 hypothetical protein [Vibrio europaeus]MDC5714159.1 hypothetical protein [Vibrio europaeus]MDC5716200.1 hypothetical protein [Vibrio europaeus]
MRTIQMVKNAATNTWVQAGVALTLSGSALADADPNGTAIKAAVDAGKSLVSLTTSGVIGIAALGFGVGMVVTWLSRR